MFYTATLNSNAVVGTDGNPNETYLTYGESDTQTSHSKTKTYTWPVSIVKYTGSDTTTNRLAGASFTLTKADVSWNASGSAITFTGSNNVYKPSTSGSATITTNSSGTFMFSGLDSGNYLLTETVAPAGFNKIANPIRVKIDISYDGTALTMTPSYTVESPSQASNSGTVSTTDSTIYVQNNTGAELPSTGGMGTTLLYVVGGAMVVFATSALVARRRATASANASKE